MRMKDLEKQFVAFNLRLKPDFKRQLEEKAEKNKRSLHSEIIHMLEAQLKFEQNES
jgi:predicted HicB family RNase H-like nuclease